MNMKKLVVWIEKSPVLKLIGVVSASWVTIYACLTYIDASIQKQILDESFMNQLAKRIRPACIFDEKRSVIFDSGAMDEVSGIQFSNLVNEGIGRGLPQKITISMKRHTPYAPLLTLLDPYAVVMKVERGPLFDWEFIITYEGQTGPENGKCRYRLELL